MLACLCGAANARHLEHKYLDDSELSEIMKGKTIEYYHTLYQRVSVRTGVRSRRIKTERRPLLKDKMCYIVTNQRQQQIRYMVDVACNYLCVCLAKSVPFTLDEQQEMSRATCAPRLLILNNFFFTSPSSADFCFVLAM